LIHCAQKVYTLFVLSSAVRAVQALLESSFS
jgi:hypothetical protein